MIKAEIIGRLTEKEINHRVIRTKRVVRNHGTLIGSVIITDIKGIL